MQLEQKQVFFVLMGILVLASGILVLGYVLGLNVAQPTTMSAKAFADGRRAQRSVVRPAEDDDSTAPVELTFHEKVMSPSPAASPLPSPPTPEEQERRGALARAAVAKAADAAKVRTIDEADRTKREAKPVAKPVAKPMAKATPKPAPKATPKAAPKPQAAKPAHKPTTVKPAPRPTPARKALSRREPADAVERKVDEAAADALSILRKLREGGSKASAAAPSPAAPIGPSERRYTVQVGAFQDRADALALLDRLRSRGHNPFLVSSKVRSRGRWFRVRVGRFADKDKAKDYQRRVETAEGLKGAFVARL